MLWAVSASICPIASLLLLMFAPRSPTVNAEWFAVFVGVVGIAFGIFTALMMSWLVAKQSIKLRAAADAVSRGRFDVDLRVARADEFGRLLGEFDNMVRESEKRRNYVRGSACTLASAQPNKFWHTILVERSRGRDHRHVCGHAFLDRTNQRICTERRSRSNEPIFFG